MLKIKKIQKTNLIRVLRNKRIQIIKIEEKLLKYSKINN